MTAYASASQRTKLGHCSIEIHSVNRKGLDLTVYAPKPLLWLDIEIRKWITAVLNRGQVTVRVNIKMNESGALENELPQLQTLQQGWRQLAGRLGYSADQVNLPFLAAQKESLELSFTAEPEFAEEMKLVVTEALEKLLVMKQEEGKALEKDILARLAWMQEQLKLLQGKSSSATDRYKQRLKEKLAEFSSQEGIDERILREVAILAEKVDITEEMVRLSSHIRQFFDYVKQQNTAVGKTLDFLSQEMQRELNTISAKCSDQDSIYLVLALKAELEKVREQVQNIE